MANNDDSSPRDMEAHCKVREKGVHPHKGTTNECRMEHSASQMARAGGDFGTPRNCKHQAISTQAYRTSVSRMFISLDLANDIVDAIMEEQGYNTPHALSCLDKKGIEQLVTAICKPGGMKGGIWNTGINVPL